MNAVTNRRPLFLLVLLAITLGSIAISIVFNLYRHDLQHVNEPLHSTLEAFGGLAAISLAVLLRQLHRDGLRGKGEYFLLSMGFFMMGALDIFHASSVYGRGFILLRSLAGLIGGVWFALVWVPRTGKILGERKNLPWFLVSITLLSGFVIINCREIFPFMVRDGKFTPAALAMNISAGILTFSAAIYFFREFLHSSKTESYLFTCMLLFLSLSSLEFPICVMWSRDWWFWHIQRYIGYTVVLYYLLWAFLRVSDELKRANALLEERIAQRTAQLTREVAERKRYAEERDKLIVELQEALARITVLTGLLPTCAACKKIKNAEGKWVQMEVYIENHSNARFTHGICPTCARTLYPDIVDKLGL